MQFVVKIFLLLLALYAFKQCHKVILTPDPEYVKLVTAAYKELAQHSIDHLPKDHFFLRPCEKADPNDMWCGQRLRARLDFNYCELSDV